MTDAPETADHGRLFLVGIGPGHPAQMTLRARAVLTGADIVIGHATYIRLVADLLGAQQVVRSGMTEEVDRARLAVELARAGQAVALISSGDSGIYGMAGLTFELLFQAGWTPDAGPSVEVVPGVSALGSCAALVGAPLTHDFCAISLSDLLTPWPVIARRLYAAAAADFVCALYNPKSGRRTAQLAEAQRLFLCLRRPDTPVAVVHAAYRPRQRVELTTLTGLLAHDIGMQTTVLIGNSQSRVRHGLLVTPRGYGDKYDLADGRTRDGEQAGRALGGGLAAWRVTVRASTEPDAALAARYGLPEAYIAAVRADAEAAPASSTPDMP